MTPVVLSLGLIVGLVPSAPVSVRVVPSAIDQTACDAMTRWRVPGMAVVVVRTGETTHLKGYGVKRHGTNDPVTPDTLFPLASCTKAFTAAAIAGLVDDGVMAWDEPARTHLPGFHLADPTADAAVTVRDLLCHRTGVGGHDLIWYKAPWRIDEVLRRVSHLPTTGRFRADYQYSSIMVMAAGRAAANAAGEPWGRLLRRRLCDPIGMHAVALTSAEAERFTDRAAGHRRTADGVELVPAYPMPEPNPAGSLHTTARDLAAWLRFQLADGKVGGKQVVTAANLRETRKPHTHMPLDDPGIRPVYPDTTRADYALGWVAYDYRGVNVVAHGGMIDGFRALMVLLPDHGLGFALLCNLDRTKMPVALANALIDQFLGLTPKDWTAYFQKVEADEAAEKAAKLAARDMARTAGTSPTLPLDRYAGEYAEPGYGVARVSVEGGKLVWAWSSYRCELEHYERDSFRITAGQFADELVEFRVRNGAADALRAVGAVFVRR